MKEAKPFVQGEHVSEAENWKKLNHSSHRHATISDDDSETYHQLIGQLDFFDGTRCAGWAFMPTNESTCVTLRVKFGDVLLIEVACDLFRPDLATAEIGQGAHAFDIVLPYPVDPSMVEFVSFVASASGTSQTLTLSGPTDENTTREYFLLLEKLIDTDIYDLGDAVPMGILQCQAHYLLRGRFDNLQPNLLFNARFYVDFLFKTSQRRVGMADALLDFAKVGQRAGMRPHPVFDPLFVTNAFDLEDRGSSLQWFLHEGLDHGFDPSYLFSSTFYSHKYNIAGSALRHFLTTGQRIGLCPSPLFDPAYVAATSDIPIGTALQTYVLSEHASRTSPHILIDDNYIRLQVSRFTNIGVSYSALELYCTHHASVDPHPLFQTQYFRSQQKSAATSPIALVDYIAQSDASMRPHTLFWDAEYRRSRPDVAKAGILPLAHYLSSGYKENVSTHPLIDHQYIKSLIRPDQGTTPLEHYASHAIQGKLSPRSAYPVEAVAKRSWHRRVLHLNATSADHSAQAPRIGLFAHIFYTDLIPDILEILQNFPAGSDCYISTDTSQKKNTIESMLGNVVSGRLEVRVLPNRGRDIAPFLVGFADRVAETDIGLHVHTKKSLHYSTSFAKWRTYLFRELAGSTAIVAANVKILENGTIGMVAPMDFAPIEPMINWGGNQPIASHLVRAMGGHLSDHLMPELPSGSMFWFKGDALRPILELGLTAEHFDAELGQIDGTLAHAIERCFFAICELAGYQFLRTTTHESVEGYVVTDEIERAASRILPSAWRRGNRIQESYHPEIARFSVEPSYGRPRLNLLLPTADTSVGYAGISEALRLYIGSLDRLGHDWDGRIIVTDVRPGNMFIPPAGFRLLDTIRASEQARRSIVNGCTKDDDFLTVRRNDVFMASAWWNACQAFDIIEHSNDIFDRDGICRRLIYLIQDDERGFNPWSTKFMLCDDTYRKADRTFAVFNTPYLSEHFSDHSLSSDGIVYRPPINEALSSLRKLAYDDRDNIVLLYARPHAMRNCLDFIDSVVSECLRMDYVYWSDWSWIAIGEDFDRSLLKSGTNIEVRGRLTLSEYQQYLQSAKLGLTIMVSPHPSYPPLEMAANGMRVVTNKYGRKDLSMAHDLIKTFDSFDPHMAATLLRSHSVDRIENPKTTLDWFFDGKTNLDEVLNAIAAECGRQTAPLPYGIV